MEKKRNSFTGSLGFIIAAAASAVGLGNIWRFPYFVARDGGGLFIVVYVILAQTFGYALLTTEVAIGRKTRQSALTAYGVLNKKARGLGLLSCLVPIIILSYYCAIGGWVVKYLLTFLTGGGESAARPDYFEGFISGTVQPVVMMGVFLLLTVVVVLGGVDKGIENFSKIVLPVLVLLIIVISVYSLTLSYTDENGNVRTALQGLKLLFIPDLSDFSISNLGIVLMDAMGQLFYSLSIAMGILIAYGSYMRDDTDLTKATKHIDFFDTFVALLAAIMIVPAVYVFQGKEGMQASGPGLIFVTLPVVFQQMGAIGTVIGSMFFALVLFAALTSSVSILEAVVSSFTDRFHMKRTSAILLEGVICLAMGTVVCLGYNVFMFDIVLPNGAHAQILDILDFISNNLMMPVISIGTCILVGWIMNPRVIIEEMTKNGESFKPKGIFLAMIRFVAPAFLVLLLLKATGLI